MQEAEIGGSQSKVNSGKSARLYQKNKLKAKGFGAWLKNGKALPSKLKALSSVLSTAANKEEFLWIPLLYTIM
jgi:hypothetical protein